MSPTQDQRAVTLLVVEDDEVDLMAIRRGFERQKLANDLVSARDGVEALQILRGENGHAPLRRPFVILLDLNLPRMDGFEFLQALRRDPDLHTCVVFVLTTSRSDEDRLKAYDSQVAGFIVKADAGAGFLKAIELLDHYWKVVVLP